MIPKQKSNHRWLKLRRIQYLYAHFEGFDKQKGTREKQRVKVPVGEVLWTLRDALEAKRVLRGLFT